MIARDGDRNPECDFLGGGEHDETDLVSKAFTSGCVENGDMNARVYTKEQEKSHVSTTNQSSQVSTQGK